MVKPLLWGGKLFLIFVCVFWGFCLFYLDFLQSVKYNFPLQTHIVGFLVQRESYFLYGSVPKRILLKKFKRFPKYLQTTLLILEKTEHTEYIYASIVQYSIKSVLLSVSVS